MTRLGRDTDLEVCGYPRCHSTTICCCVPHPDNHQLMRALCEKHWDVWHQTQEPAARAQLVFRLFHRRVRGAR